MSPKAKHLFVFSASLTTAVLAAVALTSPSNAGPRHRHLYGDDGMFIAHEWGTFTSVQGSDGIIVDGVQHELEDLPDFVHALTTHTTSPFADLGDPTHVVQMHRAYSKMETPVIYFYTDRRRRVRVRVSYTEGLLSHFFPKPTSTEGFDLDKPDSAPIDLSELVSTAAQWEVDVVPPRDADRDLPSVEPGNIYGFARDVKAAFVEADGERERFIFYRGLGHKAPNVQVVTAGSWADLNNNTGQQIPAAFALEMTDTLARFTSLGSIEGGGTRTFTVSETEFRPKAEVIADLELAVEKALAAQGLYPDEAEAMVKTWSKSWFGDLGTRVLYLVPRSATEQLLPMEMSPKPDKLVRVLVGRVEYMTRQQERAVVEHLADAASSDPERAERGMMELVTLGRFLEPKLRRAIALTEDEAIKKRGRELLAQLTKP